MQKLKLNFGNCTRTLCYFNILNFFFNKEMVNSD